MSYYWKSVARKIGWVVVIELEEAPFKRKYQVIELNFFGIFVGVQQILVVV